MLTEITADKTSTFLSSLLWHYKCSVSSSKKCPHQKYMWQSNICYTVVYKAGCILAILNVYNFKLYKINGKFFFKDKLILIQLCQDADNLNNIS